MNATSTTTESGADAVRDVTHESMAMALRPSPETTAYPPTEEQRRVIEAPEHPSLVVAGAGSGKTHTMVRRMLWLVATRGVAPSSLLGLTFTRKAAGELRERLDDGLRRLRKAGLIGGDEADLPEVSTYNAFAHRVFQEHALLIGREPDSVLLDEPGAFGLMRRIVLRSDDTALGEFDDSVATVTARALDLARAMRENGVGPDDFAAFAARIDALRALQGKKEKDGFTDLAGLIEHLKKFDRNRSYVTLAVEYERAKRERGLIEFTDQIVGAFEICRRAPEIVATLRERHAHVVLDEYQDTSVGQTRLLSELFRGHSIMAVGDPKQSIYGWRGASAANMRRFHDDFDAPRDATFTLSTSWRNDERVLAAANRVARPLSAGEHPPLPELGVRPRADEGTVTATISETMDDEFASIAEWIADEFAASANARDRAHGEEAAPLPSAAILFRARRNMAHVARELTRRGIPVRVVGLGGLLSTPEITDLAAVLRAARDPSSGSELIRLLVGARVRLGPADVAALAGLARAMDRWNQPEEARDVDGVSRAAPGLVGPDVEHTLIDALEYVASRRPDGSGVAGISATGHERLVEVASMLEDVRAHLGLPLVEVVEYAVRRAGIDIEAASNPHRPEAVMNLDAFIEHVVAYTAANPSGDIGTLLDWLEIAERRDELPAVGVEPEPGAVQLLTIHGAKGLEWDLVAVPDLVDGGLPKASRDGTGWFRSGVLPYPLRLDRDDLPSLALDDFTTQSEAKKGIDGLRAAVKEKAGVEERRLAYVAFTRAKHKLFLSASYWSQAKNPKKLSPFLLELVEAGVVPEPAERVNEERPDVLDHVESLSWPRPPIRAGDDKALREVAASVRWATDAVASSTTGAAGADDPGVPPTPWDHDIELLLRERELSRQSRPISMPDRLAASHFKDLVLGPEEAAAQWRRPIPQRPFRQTRLGTMFHAWVESRFDAPAGGGDLMDGDALELDPDELELLGIAAPTTGDAERLAELQDRFERSHWGDRRPIAVEQTIELPLAGRTVVCKLDAVYERDDGTIEVVDWKTGAAPRGKAAEWERQLQLALYTLAYSTHRGIPPERISAVLFYVGEGETGVDYRFDQVSDREQLERLLAEAEERITAFAADEDGERAPTASRNG